MRTLTTKQPANCSAKQNKEGDNRARSHTISPLSIGIPLLQRQCACGGGCPRCKEELGIQTKLKIGEPGDRYEQEAERIADEVMRMPEPSVQRQVEPEEEEEEMVQRKEIANQLAPSGQKQESPEVPPIIHEVLNSPGQPLNPDTLTFMESRFSHDFSRVRVNTDGKAPQSSHAVNAIAYTVGQDIVFAPGEYTPDTLKGKRLLAHELTHVVQQTGENQSRQDILGKARLGINGRTDGISIQRACGSTEIAAALRASSSLPECSGVSGDATGSTFKFLPNCDEFRSGTEEREFRRFLSRIQPGDFFRVHGFASMEGPLDFNLDLSCARAKKVAATIVAAGGEVVEIMAHGPTEGSAPERRSAVVEQVLIPGSQTSQPCPGGIQTVDIAIFSLPGSSRNPFSDLGFANRVFADCCLRFNAISGGSISGSVLGGDNILNHLNDCTAFSDEERAMFAAADVLSGSSGNIWIFYMQGFDPAPLSAKGLSCIPSDISGARASFPPNIYISNDADPATLAHELGHILLDAGTHHGIVDPSDPDNVMVPRGILSGQRVVLDREQCRIVFGNP